MQNSDDGTEPARNILDIAKLPQAVYLIVGKLKFSTY